MRPAGFREASEQRALNRRDRSLVHRWSSNSGFLMQLSNQRPVIALQFSEKHKISCPLLFRQAQFISPQVIPVNNFSLDRPFDI
jgi:hypothetical protein